jgi:hypothetical protein
MRKIIYHLAKMVEFSGMLLLGLSALFCVILIFMLLF